MLLSGVTYRLYCSIDSAAVSPMVTMPWESVEEGEPQGPISELRMVTLDTLVRTTHGPEVVVMCTFSMTWPDLATI